MIHSAKITKGWPLEKLVSFKKGGKPRLFRFKPGVTVLFGPNGCGKTTLLRILGAMSGCPEHGGWSELVRRRYGSKDVYPQGLAKRFGPVGNDFNARVAWDGTPTFMHLAPASDAPMIAFGMPHDVIDESEQIGLMMARVSTGQRRLAGLHGLITKVQAGIPNLMKPKDKHLKEDAAAFIAYLQKLPRKGPSTILLDEPDRSLDFFHQIDIWRKLIPAMGQKFQIIVATHSPYALLSKWSTIIEMEDGYVERSRKALDELFALWKAGT